MKDETNGTSPLTLAGGFDAGQEQLAVTPAEHGEATEDLRVPNEELQSVGEECRSPSQAPETSKEELQSMNEALLTVNAELKRKLASISTAHSDLQNLVAATDIGTLFLDSRLRIRMFTPRVAELFGVTEADIGRTITDFTRLLRFDDLAGEAETVLRDLSPVEREVATRDGSWFLSRLRPYRTIDGRIDGIVVTFIDITERRRWEESQRLLVGELSHRVKNVLTVVQSIARQTQRSSATVEGFTAAFEDRILALAGAHSLLTQRNWSGAELGELARTALGSFIPEDGARLRIAGPEVALGADAAISFAMALHELGTNALKHGALFVPGGSVEACWSVERHAGGAQVVFEWIERDGPTVVPPEREGFGSRLLKKGIARELDGSVVLDYQQEGLRCTMEFPVGQGSAI